jgi:hypothetical protein
MREQLEMQEKYVTELKHKLQVTESERNELSAVVMRAESQDLQNMKQMQDKIKSLEEFLDSRNGFINELQKANDKYKEEKSKLQGEVANARMNLSTSDDRLRELQMSTEKEIGDLKKGIEERDSHINSMSASYEQKVMDLEKSLDLARKDALENDNEFRKANESQVNTIIRLEEENSTLNKTIEIGRSQLDDLEKQIQQLQEAQIERDKRIREATEALISRTKELEYHDMQSSGMQTRIAELQKDIEYHIGQNSDLRDKNREMGKHIDELFAQIEGANYKIQELTREIESITTSSEMQIQEYKAKLKEQSDLIVRDLEVRNNLLISDLNQLKERQSEGKMGEEFDPSRRGIPTRSLIEEAEKKKFARNENLAMYRTATLRVIFHC